MEDVKLVPKQNILMVPLDRVDPNPFQARDGYHDISDLSEKIHAMRDILPDTFGFISLPTGRVVYRAEQDKSDYRVPDGMMNLPASDDGAPGGMVWRVQLAVGHRRWMAMRILASLYPDEYPGLPVSIIWLIDEEMDAVVWGENEDREDLSPIEQAKSLLTTKDKFSLTFEQLAARRKKGVPWVKNKVRLLDLPQPMIEALHKGEVSERVAASYLKLVVGLENFSPEDIEAANLSSDIEAQSWDVVHPDLLMNRIIQKYRGGLTSTQVRTEVSQILDRVKAGCENRLMDKPSPVSTPPAPAPSPAVEEAKSLAHETTAPPPPVTMTQVPTDPPSPPPIVMEEIEAPPATEETVMVTIRFTRPVGAEPAADVNVSMSVGVEGSGDLPAFVATTYGEMVERLQLELGDLYGPDKAIELAVEEVKMVEQS